MQHEGGGDSAAWLHSGYWRLTWGLCALALPFCSRARGKRMSGRHLEPCWHSSRVSVTPGTASPGHLLPVARGTCVEQDPVGFQLALQPALGPAQAAPATGGKLLRGSRTSLLLLTAGSSLTSFKTLTILIQFNLVFNNNLTSKQPRLSPAAKSFPPRKSSKPRGPPGTACSCCLANLATPNPPLAPQPLSKQLPSCKTGGVPVGGGEELGKLVPDGSLDDGLSSSFCSELSCVGSHVTAERG